MVLLPLSLYPDAGVASSLCGQAVTVTAKSTGKSVTATVYGGSDRDDYTTFSQAAYLALGGDLDAGVLDVEFSLGAAAPAAAPSTEAKVESASKPVAEAVAAPVVAAAKVETSEPKVESKVYVQLSLRRRRASSLSLSRSVADAALVSPPRSEHKTEKKTSHKDKATKIAANKAAEKSAAAAAKKEQASAAADRQAAADQQAAVDKAAADKIWADREAAKAAKAAEEDKRKKEDEEAKWAAEEAAKKVDGQKKEQGNHVADTSSGNKLAAVADTSSKVRPPLPLSLFLSSPCPLADSPSLVLHAGQELDWLPRVELRPLGRHRLGAQRLAEVRLPFLLAHLPLASSPYLHLSPSTP